MRLLKPSSHYPNMRSKRYKIFRFINRFYTLHEEYSPHFLVIHKWVKNEDNLYVLRKWIHIPLNSYARYINRKIKEYNNE